MVTFWRRKNDFNHWKSLVALVTKYKPYIFVVVVDNITPKIGRNTSVILLIKQKLENWLLNFRLTWQHFKWHCLQMHLNISVIKFYEKLSILASLSLSINRRNHRKSKWGGGVISPSPGLDRVNAQSIQTYAHLKFFVFQCSWDHLTN